MENGKWKMRFGPSRLSRVVLDGLDRREREQVLAEASAILTQQLLRSPDFDTGADQIVRKLKEMGHDLRLFDTNFDLDLDKGETSQVCAETGQERQTTALP